MLEIHTMMVGAHFSSSDDNAAAGPAVRPAPIYQSTTTHYSSLKLTLFS